MVNADFVHHPFGEKLLVVVVVRADLVKGVRRILHRAALRSGRCGDLAVDVEPHRGAVVSRGEMIPLLWDEIVVGTHIV